MVSGSICVLNIKVGISGGNMQNSKWYLTGLPSPKYSNTMILFSLTAHLNTFGGITISNLRSSSGGISMNNSGNTWLVSGTYIIS